MNAHKNAGFLGTVPLCADPKKSPFKWPVGRGRSGGLSYVHPYIRDLGADVAALHQNRFIDPWAAYSLHPMPVSKDWRIHMAYPHLAPHGVYLSRHVWLRTLGAAHQERPENWHLEKAGEWLEAFQTWNPFPAGPYPAQPKAFAWPGHLAMDVYFRMGNMLDAWATGLFAKGPGPEIWQGIICQFNRYAWAFAKLPMPVVREGNHYLVEHGLAPLLLATLLPEHPEAVHLEKHGRLVVEEVFRKNFYPDGGYAERCLPYSRYVTEHVLITAGWLAANGRTVLGPSVQNKISRHAAIFLDTVEPSGQVSPLGDGQAEPIGDLGSRAREIASLPGATKNKFHFAHHPNPGFAVLRHKEAHVLFSLRGKCLDNYHEHHDVLSVLFSLDGMRLLDDPAGEAYGNDFGVTDKAQRRLIRHHMYSVQAHNLPHPVADNRPTLKEYGPGYYGAGKWKDLGGIPQFWGGRPPRSNNFHHQKEGRGHMLSATCGFFTPAVHRRTLTLAPGILTIHDAVSGAKGPWQNIWHWGAKPVSATASQAVFHTRHFEVTAHWTGVGVTGPDPFLGKYLGKKAPSATAVAMEKENGERRSSLVFNWKRGK